MHTTLGTKLKRLRKQRGLTQEELGRQFNVVKQTISNWENDVAKPDLDTFQNIAKFYDVSLCYLLDKTTYTNQNIYCKNCVENPHNTYIMNEKDKRILDKIHILSKPKQKAIETLLGIRD